MCDFPHVLNHHQIVDSESNVTEDEIRRAVWDCGVDKSPGPDGVSLDPLRCVEESRINAKQLLSGQCMIQLNKNGVDLMSFVSKRVGDGGKTMFWLDPWLDGRLLKNDYPRLFALEGIKEVYVGQKLANGLSSGFRRDPGGVESLFLVASAWKIIEEHLSICSGTPTRWIKLVPIKVNILARRDISTNILMWWGLSVVYFASYQDWIGWIDLLKLRKEVKEYLEATFLVAW
ncbi:hypothetical protein Tco_1270709 [Tanacetum coccineum]